MKTCSKCGWEGPLDGFYANQGTCKECYKAKVRAYRAANPDKLKAQRAKRYWANPEIHREASTKWRLANPDKVKEMNASWYKANSEASNEQSRQWHIDHPEESKQQKAAWSKAHPEIVRASATKRRVLKLAYEGQHYTGADVKRLLIEQGNLCAYCETGLETYHVDHVVPLSKGGGNGPDNICLACPSCNLSKHNKLLGVEWLPAAKGVDHDYAGRAR